MIPNNMGMVGANTRSYIPNAVDFAGGTSDGVTKGSDLTGNVDHSRGILSTWLRVDGGAGVARQLVNNTGSFVNIQLSSANKFSISLFNPANQQMIFGSVATYGVSGAWMHLLTSWDMNFGVGSKLTHLYVNDVSDKTALTDGTVGACNVQYTGVAHGFLCAFGGTAGWNGAVADFFYAPAQYLDFSVIANRRKFITATGIPLSLGATGSLPTGTAPLVYLKNPAASVNVNSGTGGTPLTLVGAPTVASSSP